MADNNKKNDLYEFHGVNLKDIRNRNELRVITQLPDILKKYPDFRPDVIDIQDIYALSLNLLPAFYTQEFSIVLKKPVDDQKVREALRTAIEIVRGNPTKVNGINDQ
ncbi:MAG: late competence development ComFB family protein [Desulfobacterales bacterium]